MDTRVVDLFAGAGGLSLGATEAGARVEHAIELDEWAGKTLEANHPDTRVTCADIRRLDDSWIRREIEKYPALLVGGPPCQGFSRAGPARKDPRDPRNSLFREFVRFARELEPTAVVLENVPGILRSHTASGHLVVEIIQQELRNLGYTTQVLVLDAENFGVPQIRRRIFVLGLPPKATAVVELTHSDSGPTLFGSTEEPVLTLRDAISDLPIVDVGDIAEPVRYLGPPGNDFQRAMRDRSGDWLWNHVPMRHTARIVERFKHIRPGQSQSDVIADHAPRRRVRSPEQGVGTYDQNNRRMFWDAPCHTLAASFYANFIHPDLDRNFTVREGARIQTFPDWYVFKGKATVVSQKLLAREGRHDERHLCQYAQVGNAVPPKLARVVVGAVLEGIGGSEKPETLSA